MAIHFPLDINEWTFIIVPLRRGGRHGNSRHVHPARFTGKNCAGCGSHARRGPRHGSAKARTALQADYYKNRPETIEETAELVSAGGGKGIAVVVDHLQAEQVERLIAKIRKEKGRLHLL